MTSNKFGADVPLVHQNSFKEEKGRFQEVELSLDTVDYVNPSSDSENKDLIAAIGPDIMRLRSAIVGEMSGDFCNVNDEYGNRIYQVTATETKTCCDFRGNPELTIDVTNAFNELSILKYKRPHRSQKYQLTMCEVLLKPGRRIGSIDGIASEGIFLKSRSKETFLIYMDENMGSEDYQQAYKIYPTMYAYDVGTIRYNNKKEIVLTFPMKCKSYERYLLLSCAILLNYQLEKKRRDIKKYYDSTKKEDVPGGDVGGGDVETGGILPGGIF
ncbi:uncharacterized protein [Palaemon carinicauda]|uniref:uncharacterized protein n=1 Tax=Palaemon carinicauda TaxID=392227 RepID=UPI0035B5840B